MPRKYATWTQEDYEKFVKIWQSAANVKEVADAYDVSVQTIYNRAVNLRKKGVNLKKMKTSRQRLDWPALAQLADDLSE